MYSSIHRTRGFEKDEIRRSCQCGGGALIAESIQPAVWAKKVE
jgi:hypothetical protein